jgi:large subunit ribosomal protein L4
MATVKVYDQDKKEVGSMELAPEVFEVAVRPEILNLAVRSHRAAKRRGTHATKTRNEVRGGGRKPWRQKGTGRARAGSVRSPLWVGGGVTFGPKPRDYAFKVNRKVKRLAMRMALSSRHLDDKLMVLESISLPEIKTRLFARVAENLGLGKALIVLKDPDKSVLLSARNLPHVKVVTEESLTLYDVLKYPQLVMQKQAAEAVQDRLK